VEEKEEDNISTLIWTWIDEECDGGK